MQKDIKVFTGAGDFDKALFNHFEKMCAGQNNIAVRAALKYCNVRMWELAKALEISVSTLNRKMRDELTDHEKQEMVDTIVQIEHMKKKNGKGLL